MLRYEITYMTNFRKREAQKRRKRFFKKIGNAFAISLFAFTIGYFGWHFTQWAKRDFCVYPLCEGVYEKTDFQR